MATGSLKRWRTVLQQDPGQEGLGPHENPEDEGEVGGVEADSEELGSGGVTALVGEEVKEAVEPGVAGGVDQGPIGPGDQTVVGGVGQEGGLFHVAGPVYVEVGHQAGQGQGQEEVQEQEQEQEGAGQRPGVTGLAPPGRPP